MMLIDVLSGLMLIHITVCTAWRATCLFRKKGSCTFHRCPFRRDYTDSSCVYFPDSGCTKCPPTDEELEIYRRTPEGIMESLEQGEDG